MKTLLAVTMLICALFMALASMARAHDWYPMECCSGMDCAPVEKVEMIPAASYASLLGTPAGTMTMAVTTRHGTAVVPPALPRRTSQDHRMHACMRHTSMGVHLICIFMPPGS